jgi:hypothetical protein
MDSILKDSFVMMFTGQPEGPGDEPCATAKNTFAASGYPQGVRSVNYDFGKTFLPESMMCESGFLTGCAKARGPGELQDAG